MNDPNKLKDLLSSPLPLMLTLHPSLWVSWVSHRPTVAPQLSAELFWKWRAVLVSVSGSQTRSGGRGVGVVDSRLPGGGLLGAHCPDASLLNRELSLSGGCFCSHSTKCAAVYLC